MKKQSPIHTITQVKKKYPRGIDRLEIGSGEHPEPGFVHVDIQQCKDVDILADVRKLPIPDNFVTAEIRAVHIMEHFCHPEYSSKQMRDEIGSTVEVLKECYRVLAPGAKITIVTPDFEKITDSAVKKRVSYYWLQRWTVGGHLNMFDVHHWLWTRADAAKWFKEVGYTDVEDWNPVKGLMQKVMLNWDDPRSNNNTEWFKTEWYHWLFISAKK